MDGPVFDAMLKTALEEALREDLKELDRQAPVQTSFRHRRRMRALLRNMTVRRPAEPEEAGALRPVRRRPGRPARWAAVAVLAALLVVPAAYAIQSGAFFRQMFEKSGWAEMYGDAANTEQLLDMGVGSKNAVAESASLRVELLDAVSGGENAMLALRLTVLDEALLAQLTGDRENWSFHFLDMGGSLLENQRQGVSYGMQLTAPWTDASLRENQFLMIFTVNNSALAAGGSYQLILRDLGWHTDTGETCLAAGEWVLDLELTSSGSAVYPERSLRLGAQTCVLEKLSLSPLAANLELRCQTNPGRMDLDILGQAVFRMKDGRTIDQQGYFCGISAGGNCVTVNYEFQMPLDTEAADCMILCGEEIPLPQAQQK